MLIDEGDNYSSTDVKTDDDLNVKKFGQFGKSGEKIPFKTKY